MIKIEIFIVSLLCIMTYKLIKMILINNTDTDISISTKLTSVRNKLKENIKDEINIDDLNCNNLQNNIKFICTLVIYKIKQLKLYEKKNLIYNWSIVFFTNLFLILNMVKDIFTCYFDKLILFLNYFLHIIIKKYLLKFSKKYIESMFVGLKKIFILTFWSREFNYEKLFFDYEIITSILLTINLIFILNWFYGLIIQNYS